MLLLLWVPRVGFKRVSKGPSPFLLYFIFSVSQRHFRGPNLVSTCYILLVLLSISIGSLALIWTFPARHIKYTKYS